MASLSEQFGPIDIYVFDQLLRGRITAADRILDAGCGGGRNLTWMLANGFDVRAVDESPGAVAQVGDLIKKLAPKLEGERALVAEVDDLPFPDASFEVVLASAVLHFARDDTHFDAMLSELLRVLAPGGLFFARLASDIGLENALVPLGENRYRMPDGTDRYVVNEARLLAWTERCGGTLLDPIKTTNVQGLRCMTTWVLRLPPGPR